MKTGDKPKIIVICGPTGSGKTGLAVSLCKKFNGEIVNADSRQVYKHMDIGTAKLFRNKKLKIKYKKYGMPSACYLLDNIPAWLIDIVEPNERYNVGRFKKDAEAVIKNIVSRGKVPFLVGGTGLYIDGLIDNFQFSVFNFQSISNNPIFKQSLKKLARQLLKLDPKAKDIVDLKNRRRVGRALEFCLATGKKFSESRKKGERKYEVLKIAPRVYDSVGAEHVLPNKRAQYIVPLQKLYDKINRRVDQMIDQGLENEVKMLAKKYGWDSEAMTGIGYREWRDYFVGAALCGRPNSGNHTGLPLQQVKDQIKKDTRNYAKRQMTWFKRDKEINWVKNAKDAEKLVEIFLK